MKTELKSAAILHGRTIVDGRRTSTPTPSFPCSQSLRVGTVVADDGATTRSAWSVAGWPAGAASRPPLISPSPPVHRAQLFQRRRRRRAKAPARNGKGGRGVRGPAVTATGTTAQGAAVSP